MDADDTEWERAAVAMGDAGAAMSGPAMPTSVGARLAAARAATGLTVEQIATTTRIQPRYLVAMETGDLAALPGRTYSIGFARTYARAVGLPEGEVATAMRAELDGSAPLTELAPTATFSSGDPARVPSAGLAWIAGAAVLGVAIAGLLFWRNYYLPAGTLPSLLPTSVASAPATHRPALGRTAVVPEPAGAVVFTATKPALWVKFYDATGKQLMQKQLAQGESYTVPADANGPKIWTGRPDALTITIGGHPVAKLADEQRMVKDMPVSAAALLARKKPTPPIVAPTPAPTLTHSPASTRGLAAPAPSASPSATPKPTTTPKPATTHRAPVPHTSPPRTPATAVPLTPGPIVSGTPNPDIPASAPAPAAPVSGTP